MDATGAYAISQQAKECVYNIRVSLIGDSDVGKTSISLCFRGEDTKHPRSTVGYDFGTAYRKYDNGDSVRYVIVDTAGQERYSSSLPNYMRDSDAVVVVYDVTHRSSFEHIDRWLSVVYTRLPCDTPMVLVGNKCDKLNERDVSTQEGNEKAELHNMHFLETSAKSGHQIHGIFEHLSTVIRDKKLTEMFNGAKRPLSSLAIRLPSTNATNRQDKSRKCCLS